MANTTQIQLRTTHEQRAAWRRAAEQRGMTVAAMIREALRRQLAVGDDAEEVRDVSAAS